MDCANGDDCSEGDKLEIRRCSSSQRDQRFVYEPLPGTGGGRIKPYHKQDLCLERTTDRQHTLESCDDVNEIVSERQILLGFDWQEEFKLIPLSRDDHCLTQQHWPRSGEVVYADDCEDACDDNTCFWEPIYVEEFGGLQVRVVTGSEGCSPSNPCPQCYGDCDEDDECEGDLECYKRVPGDPVPSCAGGEQQDNCKKCTIISIGRYNV